MMVGGVVVCSGGLDSTTLLYKVHDENIDPIFVLTFNYGQRHKKEIEFSKWHCKELHIPQTIVDIRSIQSLIAKGALTSSVDIPHAHYSEESQKITIVPNRNMIFLSLAVGFAVTKEVSKVYYAAHKSDYSIYPDCRKEFVKALDTAIYLGNLWTPVELKAPFIDKTKIDIVSIGEELNVPYEHTWSCYTGKERPCLVCGTCLERIEAFDKNRLCDPLLTGKEWDVGLENLKYYSKRR